MSSTLSLEASKKVFEIVGEYETEKCWEGLLIDVGDKFRWRVNKRNKNGNPAKYPAPNFSEVVRVLPMIGEKKKWNAGWGRSGTCLIDVLYNVSIIYMNAPREPEGMAAVETYLMKLL